MKFIDSKLHLNDISWKLLHRLAKLNLEFIQKEDNVDFQTSTWYNGRERGFCIEVSRFSDKNHLYICWAEHRNSNEIRIFNITCPKLNRINPFKVEDLKDEKTRKEFWGSSRSFSPNDLEEAANHVMELINSWYQVIVVNQVMSA